MQFLNLIKDNVESPYTKSIYEYLNPYFNDNVTLIARMWQQKYSIDENQKFIVFITSAEGHRYTPCEKERLNKNCLGVFMDYYPKQVKTVEDQFNPNGFKFIENVYQKPLGTANFFGNSNIPILDRKYNVTFIGQLDPYVRYDIYHAIQKYSPSINDGKFVFYEGWNNGLGHENYSEIMSNTKIALVPCGSASLDTFRFYEACQAGCVILTIKQNNYEFMEGSPHIEIPSWDSFKEYIDYLLENPQKLVKISEKTKSFWDNNLSPQAAAKFILKKLGVNHE